MRTEAAALGLSAALPARAGEASGPAEERPATSALSFGLAIAFLMALLANLPLVVPALAVLAPAQLLAAAGLAVVFVERTLGHRPFVVVWPESHLLLAYLGVAALSAVTALWPGWAVESTIELAKLVAVYFLLVNVVESWGRLSKASAALGFGSLIPAIGAIVAWRAGEVVEGRARWLGTFENPNDLAFTLVVLLPFLLAHAANARGGKRFAFLAAAAVPVWAILLTFSRGGMIGLAVVLALSAVLWSGPWLRLPALFVVAVALVFGATHFWERDEGFAELGADSTVAQRLDSIRAGLAMAEERPLLGVGFGCSVIGFEHYAPSEHASNRSLHSHNTAVQALAETGSLGFVLYALLVGAAIVHTRRRARACRAAGHEDRYRSVSAVEIALWGFLACGMAGGYLLSWYPYLLFGFASAIRRLPRLEGEPRGEAA